MSGKKPLWSPRYQTVIANEAIANGTAVTLITNEITVEAVDALKENVHGFANGAALKKNDSLQIYKEGGEAVGLAGGAITLGARLKVDAAGKLIAATVAGEDTVGYSLEAAADGDLVAFAFTRSQVPN